jgi:general secretion pathway protein I
VRRGRTEGFTLVEILVALLVLAIALAATARSLGAAIDTTAALRERTLARWVAEDQLTELELSGEWPALDTKEGKSTMAAREFVWRRETSATPYPRMRRVEMSVLPAGAETPIVRLTAFVEQTTPQPGAQSGAQPVAPATEATGAAR